MQQFKFDNVILSLGFRPNLSFLDTQQFQTHVTGALITNCHGQTSVSNVYAAGDCAATFNTVTGEKQWLALATNALRQAVVVASDILYRLGLTQSHPVSLGAVGTSAIKVFDTYACSTGLTVQQIKNKNSTIARTLGLAENELKIKSITVEDAVRPEFITPVQRQAITVVWEQTTGRLLGVQTIGNYQSNGDI